MWQEALNKTTIRDNIYYDMHGPLAIFSVDDYIVTYIDEEDYSDKIFWVKKID